MASFSPLAAPACFTVSDPICRATCGWGAGDGVHCLAPDGTLLGKIRVPEVVANVCFGGPKRNRLFICGTTSLYSIYLKTQGLPR